MSTTKAFSVVAGVLVLIAISAVVNTDEAIEPAVWLGVLVCVYFAPTFIALRRKVPHLGSVAVVNTFLGWTFIGWVVALAMAAKDPRSS